MKVQKLIWLDDIRDPFANNGEWLVFSPIQMPYEVYWVKSYQEFVSWITFNGLPEVICFDHDLGDPADDEKTGHDCAKWLVEYCMDHEVALPLWAIQSANPVGRDNINGLLNSYKRSCQG